MWIVVAFIVGFVAFPGVLYLLFLGIERFIEVPDWRDDKSIPPK